MASIFVGEYVLYRIFPSTFSPDSLRGDNGLEHICGYLESVLVNVAFSGFSYVLQATESEEGSMAEQEKMNNGFIM